MPSCLAILTEHRLVTDRQTDRHATRSELARKKRAAPCVASCAFTAPAVIGKIIKIGSFWLDHSKKIINSFFATQCARYYVARQLLCKNLSKSDIRTWISISTAKPANCTPISFKTTAAIWLRCIGSVNRTIALIKCFRPTDYID